MARRKYTYATLDPQEHPTLARHIAEGRIRLDGREYVGYSARDGVEVQFGGIDDCASIESYLVANGPEVW